VQKQNTNTPQRRTAQAFDGSNSLADLAARIRAFHQATAEALRRSVENAMAAGDLLIEAKAQLKHGQWLPWLRDHCAMSERTAQLYMRCAKNRAAIEEQVKSATVADLTLNEAAAVLVLTSDMRKVINFAREMEHLSGEELIEHCIAEGVGVIVDDSYDMFAGRSDAEKLEWHWFAAFLSYDGDAGRWCRSGGEPQHVWDHVEYLLQGRFQNVTELLGEKGDRYREFYGIASLSEQFKAAWAAFRDQHRDCTLADAEDALKNLQRKFEQARSEGCIQSNASRARRRRI
jgi:Protein of unknown function (DUF3102)